MLLTHPRLQPTMYPPLLPSQLICFLLTSLPIYSNYPSWKPHAHFWKVLLPPTCPVWCWPLSRTSLPFQPSRMCVWFPWPIRQSWDVLSAFHCHFWSSLVILWPYHSPPLLRGLLSWPLSNSQDTPQPLAPDSLASPHLKLSWPWGITLSALWPHCLQVNCPHWNCSTARTFSLRLKGPPPVKTPCPCSSQLSLFLLYSPAS